MDRASTNQLLRVAQLVGLLLIAYLLYVIGTDVYNLRHTGLLKVTTTSPDAVVSISRAGSAAEIIGTGSANLHIKPGDYLVVAANNGKQTSSVVQVRLKQTAAIKLDLNKRTLLPSVDDIQFQNIDELINNGMTVDQISNVKSGFFDFKNRATTVNIMPGSVEPGPRNPDTATGFILDFSVDIDKTNYKATVSFDMGNPIHLTLIDQQTNTKVFDKTVNDLAD